MSSAWLPEDARPDVGVRLFCFHAAGSGASAFRAWPRALPEWIDVRAVQLPGRESRMRESPFRHMSALVDALAEALAAELEIPFAFFGHSLGGRIAFELTRSLEARGAALPARVIMASTAEPETLSAADHASSSLPDAEFEAYVARFGGFPDDLRRFPRQFRAICDLLRADLALLSSADVGRVEPLRSPLHVIGASGDPMVRRENLEPWRRWVSDPGRFEVHWFEGDHFFIQERTASVATWMAALLEQDVRRREGSLD